MNPANLMCLPAAVYDKPVGRHTPLKNESIIVSLVPIESAKSWVSFWAIARVPDNLSTPLCHLLAVDIRDFFRPLRESSDNKWLRGGTSRSPLSEDQVSHATLLFFGLPPRLK